MDNQTPEPQSQTSSSDAVQAPTQTIDPVALTPDVTNINHVFSQIAEKIIEQQEAVIGPIAVEQAKQIQDLTINWPQHQVTVSGNPQKAIDDLVQKYKELFGQIAVQVSRDASVSFLAQLPADQQPKSLTE